MDPQFKEILNQLDDLINRYGAEYVGNNFNEFFDTEKIDNILIKLRKSEGNFRQIKSSIDVTRGILFEIITVNLINKTFESDKSYNHIKCCRLSEKETIRKKFKGSIFLQNLTQSQEKI